jgi:hypothetical protein
MKFSILWLLAAIQPAFSIDLISRGPTGGDLCFLWLNAENLFYPENDSVPADDEYTPEGLFHWTWDRYRDKLTALAKVIIASGGWEPPGLVCLCEVENARLLEDLAAHPILARYGYLPLHKEGPDHRGLEVACLVREKRFSALCWETFRFAPPVSATREMMHLTLCTGRDTLDLFLVHLVSKYGGAGATAELRRIQAGQLVKCMDSVAAVRTNSMIIAAGDFNDEFSGYSLEPLRTARIGGDTLTCMDPGGPGSYKYKGEWSLIDQVLVNSSFTRFTIRVSLLLLPPLMTEDQEYGGMKPRRTYAGYQYRGGVSDHLPLVIHLTHAPPSAPHGQ